MGFFSSSGKCVLASVKSTLQSATLLTLDVPYLAVMSVESAKLKDATLTINLVSSIPCLHLQSQIEAQLLVLLASAVEAKKLSIGLTYVAKRANNSGSNQSLKQIVLVASGKGGVGKSTTAANIALALAHGGAQVGVLDADIYGPSVPALFGAADQRATTSDGKLLQPIVCHGIKTMSMGYLMEKGDATVWRGPMASRALNQLLDETEWGDLDYLIVDMPPGTGDIQLTMSGKVPVSGAVVVTTPQNLALNDAQKGISMFNKVNVPVLGVIENMSYHQCSQCGHQDAIFGSEGGEALAQDNKVALIGRLPLDAIIAQDSEKGVPTMLSQDSPLSEVYRNIALQLAIKLNQTNLSIPLIVGGA